MAKQAKTKRKESVAAETLRGNLSELKLQLQVCADRRLELSAGGFDKDLATAAASLGRAITQATAELRQQEKHDSRMIDAASPEERLDLLCESCRDLKRNERAKVRAFLDELDKEDRGLLGS